VSVRHSGDSKPDIPQVPTATDERRFFHRQAGLRSENTAGIDVFDEDWDTLVVFDACRYDVFEPTSQINGSLLPNLKSLFDG
jgi:hypothetical protein